MEPASETFARPAVGAIIERIIDEERCILLQERRKPGGGTDNGLLEIPAGKVREYESVFDALRREVREETGLSLTEIEGEEQTVTSGVCGVQTFSPEAFCITQNLNGCYSLLLLTFICRAAGEPLARSDEAASIRWERAADVEKLLNEHPERFFAMHLNALRKYLNSLNG